MKEKLSESVFKYFEEISAIPRGSGNMEKISSYCLDFAKKHSLKAVRDDYNNVIIYKEGTDGYTSSEPIILQGHLDMVCQKDADVKINFEQDPITLITDGDFLKAKGTTLGADNGIAVCMILAILESSEIEHPPIEAVFTTDEEIGMIGASHLDLSLLKGKKMINIDSEDPEVLTVSCAGGSEFKVTVPLEKFSSNGRKLTIKVSGLKGGHSGVEIDKERINANILLARILNYANSNADFELIEISGGDKTNAITNSSFASVLVKDAEQFISKLTSYISILKTEIAEFEETAEISVSDEGDAFSEVISSAIKDKLIYFLLCAPSGVQRMSRKIENLVETSLNMGILNTTKDEIIIQFALRSNKESALRFLEDKLKTFSTCLNCTTEVSGQYPPWEYNENSELQKLYIKAFVEKFSHKPKVAAIHAGLECGVFSAGIKDFDCISTGVIITFYPPLFLKMY